MNHVYRNVNLFSAVHLIYYLGLLCLYILSPSLVHVLTNPPQGTIIYTLTLSHRPLTTLCLPVVCGAAPHAVQYVCDEMDGWCSSKYTYEQVWL